MLSSRILPLPTPSDSTSKDTNTNNNGKEEKEEEEEEDTSAETLFTTFLPHLFPDEAHACLGDPGQSLLYTSDRYGELLIEVPGYGGGREVGEGAEAGRELFAHYLWGGALVIAESVEAARAGAGAGAGAIVDSEKMEKWWDVKGLKVLELGAGAALPSLIATLSGAESVTITDHPSSSALYGPAQNNISNNISSEELKGRVSVHPHAWGLLPDSQEPDIEESGGETMRFAAENKGRFDRIICADCLWMKSQHENLARSIAWFLTPPDPNRSQDRKYEERNGGDDAHGDGVGPGGVAWVVAGFHTGRAVVASFLDTAVSMGLVVEHVWERDVNAPSEAGEVTREWCPVREGEGLENSARWCMVAFLRKKMG